MTFGSVLGQGSLESMQAVENRMIREGSVNSELGISESAPIIAQKMVAIRLVKDIFASV